MNKTTLSPIDYAQKAAHQMMKNFSAADLPPKGRFHYHQGVFLSGIERTYLTTGDEEYYNYIKNWADSVIDADGNIAGPIGVVAGGFGTYLKRERHFRVFFSGRFQGEKIGDVSFAKP